MMPRISTRNPDPKPGTQLNYSEYNNPSSRSQTQNREDMVKKLTSLIAENRPVLDSIAWTLHILEGANIGTMGALEKRTTLQFCHEEYCAPNLFTMTTAFATDIAEALKFNTTVKSLTIRGHYGCVNCLLNCRPRQKLTDLLLLVLKVYENAFYSPYF
jgi:hypothetical protein